MTHSVLRNIIRAVALNRESTNFYKSKQLPTYVVSLGVFFFKKRRDSIDGLF